MDVLEPVEPLRGHLQAIDAERMNRIIRMAETNNRLQTLERDRENELAELDRVHIEYKQLVLASDLFRKEASDIRQVLERTEASRVSLESSVRAQQMRADLLETEKRQQEASYTALRLQYDRVEEQLHTARIDLEKANRERQQLENLRKQFDLQAQELDETRGVLTHVFSTRSWKWTKPIRQLEGAIRRLFRARPSPAHPISRWPAIAPDLPAPADDSPAPRGSYAAYCARMLLTENRMIASQQRAASKRDLPLVSVVLPMRSFQELLLRKACNSLLEQTYPHWELIIVNDGCLHPALPVIVADLQHAAPDHVRLIKTGEDGPERTGLRASSGAYVAWMDAHDEWEADALERMLWAMHGSAMMNLGYADHDMLDAIGIRGNPTLKPACSPELLLQGNYIGPTFMVRTEAAMACLNQADRTADFRYILLLQLCEVPERVVHVPHVLFHLRIAALTKERIDADRHAIETTLQRRNLPHAVEQRDLPRSTYPVFRLGFSASHSPIVTLIIPMKDGADLLRTCIESIRARTDYPAYEILVIDNGSQEPQTLQYLRDANVRVLRIETDSFNFAAINTQAAQAASSELLLFLNSDTKPASPGWLRELVGTMRLDPRIGAVAPKLLYPITVRGMRVQHAGMLLGRHLASLIQFPTRQELGWNLFNQVTHNCAAVSGAALLTRKTLFFEVGGFDAEHFAVDFCDVDYCLKLLERGFRTVCVPSAELYHLESASRGDNKGRGATLNPKEAEAFRTKWGYLLPHDPYYHPHLLRDGGLFRMDPAANPDAQPRRATTHLVNVAVPQPPSQ